MKKAGTILRVSLGVIAVLLLVLIHFTIGWRPFLGPRARAVTTRQYERTPERLARGRYLTQGLLACDACHSVRDWTKHGAPLVAGMDLAGQVLQLPGFPGTVVAPNLTPDQETGTGNWSDDQIGRAIREGIRHDGQTLFPVMPYMYYKNMSDEDLASVVVYLRSMIPVHNALPRSKIDFPVNYLVRSVPEPVTKAVYAPDAADVPARGKYLATLGCGCHNPGNKQPWGGGEVLNGPWGSVVSPNLTQDASGISYYSETTFLTALRSGYVGARELNSIMPFSDFKNLSDDDLKAVFAYLKTVKPVKHRVDNSLPPTYCKICREKHGAGNQN